MRKTRRFITCVFVDITMAGMSLEESNTFLVSGVRTGTCIACDKETQVFDVVFRQQAMTLCPRDFFKQVRIVGSASPAPKSDTSDLAGR